MQAGEGSLEPYNSEIRRAHRRRKMDANDARTEMEANFHKVFYMMADKVDKLFADYEERMEKEREGSEVKKEDKEVKDESNASVNQAEVAKSLLSLPLHLQLQAQVQVLLPHLILSIPRFLTKSLKTSPY